VILDDPLANSYLQDLYAPGPDPNLTTEVYERTWEQNEELGVNDMKVEGYESGEAGFPFRAVAGLPAHRPSFDANEHTLSRCEWD